MNNEQI